MISLFLTSLFLFGGIQQQIKVMEVVEEITEVVEKITVVLKDGEKSVSRDLLEYSKTIKDMLDDSKKGEEIDLGIFDITKKQWGVIEELLKFVNKKNKQELQNIIQKLTLEQLVELSNNVTSFDIKLILEKVINSFFQRIQQKPDLGYNPVLQKLVPDLQDLVIKKLLFSKLEEYRYLRIPESNTESVRGRKVIVYPKIVVYSPDGKSLAAGFSDGKTYVWNTTTDELKYILHIKRISELPSVYITSLSYSPDGKYLSVGFSDGNINVWYAATGTLNLSVSVGSGSVIVWDEATGFIKTSQYYYDPEGCTSSINSLTYSSGSQEIVVSYFAGTVFVLNIVTGKIIKNIKVYDSNKLYELYDF